jgi:hypothetical protein
VFTSVPKRLGVELPIVQHGAFQWTALGGGVYSKSVAGWGGVGGQAAHIIGKTYRLSFRVDAVTAGTVLQVYRRNASNTDNEIVSTISVATGSTYAVNVQIVSGSSPFNYVAWIDNNTFTGTISNISVRELKGNHATQSTAGNRPVFTSVPKRLGVELVTRQTHTIATGTQINIAMDITNLASYVVEYSASAPNVANLLFYANGQVGFFTVAGGFNRTVVAINTASTTSVDTLRISGLSSGTIEIISVREVLEWTNAASFNGTTNSLQLATNPIGANLSQPYTIIVAGVVGALGAVRGFCGDGVRYFRIFENGVVGPSHAGVGGSLTTTTLSAGQPYVVEIVFTGSACSIWINGTLERNNAPFSPPTFGTAGSFSVGHRGDTTQFFNGQLTAVTAFDRVLSDSERTTIGKAFARELGVTYG